MCRDVWTGSGQCPYTSLALLPPPLCSLHLSSVPVSLPGLSLYNISPHQFMVVSGMQAGGGNCGGVPPGAPTGSMRTTGATSADGDGTYVHYTLVFFSHCFPLSALYRSLSTHKSLTVLSLYILRGFFLALWGNPPLIFGCVLDMC